jgi:cellulose 1,4-beta-cellobiosidase
VDGISQDEYNNRYGVSTAGSTLRINYLTQSEFGLNVGARLYLIGEDNNYRLFHLKNRELTITADVSTLSCGLNGALYFSQMDGDGGVARFPDNQAGAAYGLGYCDAQCPHGLRFSNGLINTEGYTDYGVCCTEMDILEANRWASTYTTHGCLADGYYACYDVECGDGDNYYNGLCDKTGCEFSPARQNNRYFLGYNTSFELQTSQPFTSITQFITDDGTDTGNLVEIRRRWFQNGVEIPNPVANWGYSQNYDSINDGYCNEYKSFFGEFNDYSEQGGLNSMAAAFDRGMVLAFSLWEDATGYMQWLDSLSPPDGDPDTPGVYRGPCPVDAGHPDDNHANNPDAFVTFSDIKIGTIGSTF